MKILAKAALGAAAIVSAALASAAPAEARSDFGVYLNVGPGYGYRGDPCYRPYYARPAYCDYPVYSGPVFFDRWYDGPFHYRDYRGHREYWYGGGWRGGRQGGDHDHDRGFDRGRHHR